MLLGMHTVLHAYTRKGIEEIRLGNGSTRELVDALHDLHAAQVMEGFVPSRWIAGPGVALRLNTYATALATYAYTLERPEPLPLTFIGLPVCVDLTLPAHHASLGYDDVKYATHGNAAEMSEDWATARAAYLDRRIAELQAERVTLDGYLETVTTESHKP